MEINVSRPPSHGNQSVCMLCCPQAPITWEPVSVKPVKTADGRVTVPDEVLHSMERNKIGLKGTFSTQRFIACK